MNSATSMKAHVRASNSLTKGGQKQMMSVFPRMMMKMNFLTCVMSLQSMAKSVGESSKIIKPSSYTKKGPKSTPRIGMNKLLF